MTFSVTERAETARLRPTCAVATGLRDWTVMYDTAEVLQAEHRYLVHEDWWLKQSHDCAEVAVGGTIDYLAVPFLLEALLECLHGTAGQLVVDVREVDLPSAACLGALDEAQSLAHAGGIELRLRMRRRSTAYRVAMVGLRRKWTFELA